MNTPNDQKIEEILNSLSNGQKKQMVSQIKAYGVNQFHIDLWDHLTLFDTPRAYARFTDTILTYHRVNQTLRN